MTWRNDFAGAICDARNDAGARRSDRVPCKFLVQHRAFRFCLIDNGARRLNLRRARALTQDLQPGLRGLQIRGGAVARGARLIHAIIERDGIAELIGNIFEIILRNPRVGIRAFDRRPGLPRAIARFIPFVACVHQARGRRIEIHHAAARQNNRHSFFEIACLLFPKARLFVRGFSILDRRDQLLFCGERACLGVGLGKDERLGVCANRFCIGNRLRCGEERRLCLLDARLGFFQIFRPRAEFE